MTTAKPTAAIRADVTVALATTDGECVNQHFGSAQRFVVYGMTSEEYHLISSKEFDREAQDGNEDKLRVKLDWLRRSAIDVVVCTQVGQSAARQLLAAGTQPIAVSDRPSLVAVLNQLKKDLVEGNAAWLKRLKREKPSVDGRMDALLDEEWSEEA